MLLDPHLRLTRCNIPLDIFTRVIERGYEATLEMARSDRIFRRLAMGKPK